LFLFPKVKLAVKGQFWVNRRHSEVCNTGLKMTPHKMHSRNATNNGSTTEKGVYRHKGYTLKMTTL
jgi:hypothetical protein